MRTADMRFAPIALFVYNRPQHTRRLLDSLLQNREAAESELYIFSDAPNSAAVVAKVSEVRHIIGRCDGFSRVHLVERKHNLGLAGSIVDGVSRLCNAQGRAIVLEDDLVVSRFFLRYVNDALDLYAGDERVISIGCYTYPVGRPLPETFFLRVPDCWGWGVWQRSWKLYEADGMKLLTEIRRRGLERGFDFGGTYPFTRMLEDQIAGRNSSWAVRWYATAFLREMLTLYPGHSVTRNAGMDASGVHSGHTKIYDVPLATTPVTVQRIALEEDQAARQAVTQFFAQTMRPNPLATWAGRVVRSIRSRIL